MPHPRVSVIVASYNHASYVRAALDSALSQQGVALEVLVTDDGSTDGTAQAVAAVRDERLHLRVLPANRGACVAMNEALSRARGEFVAVLNSDDLFLPGKLHTQVRFLDSHPEVGAVFGWPQLVDERGAPFADAGHKDHAVFHVANRPRHAWLRHFFDHGNALCHPTVMIRRRLYDELGAYDARLAQVPDLDLWMRLAMRCEIHVLPQPLTAFRIRDGLANASAARPEVLVRDAWERAQLLHRYLRLPRPELERVFPEFAGRAESAAELLAEHALSLGQPFFTRFALDALFHALPPHGDSPAYRRLIARTGRHDLHRLLAAG